MRRVFLILLALLLAPQALAQSNPLSAGTRMGAGGGGLTTGTTTIASCGNTRVLFDDSGVVGCDAGLTFDETNDTINLGGATLTASDPILDLTQTWNSAGVTFTGLKANITSTASAAASLLMDLQVGGATKFDVRKDGRITVPSTGSLHSATILSLVGDSGGIGFEANGVNAAEFQADRLRLNYGTPIIAFNNDLFLVKDAANTLAQRNGTAAQTLRWYYSFTDASNRANGAMRTAATYIEVAAETAGTGADNIDVLLTPAGTGIVYSAASIKSTGATAGVGYATGAGGTVTQATSRSTGVTLDKITGQITTTADSLAAITIVTFTVTNSAVAATDTIVLSKVSGDADTNAWVSAVGAGSFAISLRNNDAIAADTTAFVANFAIIKGVTS